MVLLSGFFFFFLIGTSSSLEDESVISKIDLRGRFRLNLDKEATAEGFVCVLLARMPLDGVLKTGALLVGGFMAGRLFVGVLVVFLIACVSAITPAYNSF